MKTFYKILTMAIFAIGLTSCLKDEMIEKQVRGTTNIEGDRIIELSSGSSHSTAFSLLLTTNADTTLNAVTVNLAAKDVAQEDITVQLSVDNSSEIIENWNSNNPSNLVQDYPEALYAFPAGLTVTIPKGSRTVALPITINPSQLDPSTPFAIGFRIESVTQPGYVISGNFTDLLVRFGAKSQYEGTYEMTAVITGGANATTTETEDLYTVNANTVAKDNIGGYFGGYTEYTFNADGTISVGAFDSPGGGSYGANVVESSYDAATGDFHVKFNILGGAYTFDESAVRE